MGTPGTRAEPPARVPTRSGAGDREGFRAAAGGHPRQVARPGPAPSARPLSSLRTGLPVPGPAAAASAQEAAAAAGAAMEAGGGAGAGAAGWSCPSPGQSRPSLRSPRSLPPPPPALLPPDPQVLRVLSRLPPPWPPPETALHPWTWAVPSLAVTPQALPTSSLQLVRGGGGGPGGSRVCTLPIHKSS